MNNYHHVRGGSDRCYLELNRLLVRKQHAVSCLSTAHVKNEACAGPHAFIEPIDLVHPTPADIFRFHHSRCAADAIRTLLRAHPPDIAHLHIYYGQLTSSILAPLRRAGVPIVQSLHEYKLACAVDSFISNGEPCEACAGGHFWKALPRRCNRNSLARTLVSVTESYLARARGAASEIDHFIAVSDFVRTKMIQHGIPSAKITTIHNFIDTGGIRPASQPGEYFLYLGRIERVKGVFTLLKAAAHVPDTPLLVAGAGEDRTELQRRIDEGGHANVRLLGFRGGEDLAELIRGALCVVIPSECYETFGLAALEAMAHARPVVASRIGGLPELVGDGKDGFLVDPGNAETLGERLQWMAGHPREAAQMGAHARASVEERFTAERHYDRTLDVYSRVLA